MSDAKPMRTMELRIDKATAYTISKGRMPWDVFELRDWLREYAAFEVESTRRAIEAYEQHMAVCNRPIMIQGQTR